MGAVGEGCTGKGFLVAQDCDCTTKALDGRPRVSAAGWGLAEGEVCITIVM